MSSSPSKSPFSNQPLGTALIIIAALVLLLSVFVCGFISGFVLGDSLHIAGEQPGTYPTPDGIITITVSADGCHVDRTELAGSSPVDSLTWVVSDIDGLILLERNAEGEYNYGYYQSGKFRIHLKGWYQGRYHQISNEVVVDCP